MKELQVEIRVTSNTRVGQRNKNAAYKQLKQAVDGEFGAGTLGEIQGIEGGYADAAMAGMKEAADG